MTTVALTDHDLTLTEFSNFELNLQSRGAVLRATTTGYTTPEGTERVRLTDTVVEFDPAASTAGSGTASEAELEKVWQALGFQRRTP